MPSRTRRRASTAWRALISVGALVAAAAASPVATGSAGTSPAPEVPAENRPFVSGDVAPVVTTSITPEQPTRDLDEFVREFFEGSR